MINEHSNYQPPTAELINEADETEMPPVEPLEGSPLSLKNLGYLLFRPSRFFSDKGSLLKSPEIILVIWMSGMTGVIYQLDEQLFKADYGIGAAGELLELLSYSWLGYWGFVLMVGAPIGLLYWYLAGWWYRVRLSWSGAKDVTPTHARAAYMYQDLVETGPTVFISALLAVGYANYSEYWADEYLPSILLSSCMVVFPLLACFTSYKAARTFNTRKWPARIWFLILPLLFYCLGIALILALAFWWGGSPLGGRM